MTNSIKEWFPTPWLSAADLEGDTLSTISFVRQERVGKDQKLAPIAYFKDGVDKPMILNRTNARSIGKLWGGDHQKWEGKQVTLYPSRVDVQGETKDCIRVREELPKTPMATAAALDDEIPF
jgi:hypothetical protein